MVRRIYGLIIFMQNKVLKILRYTVIMSAWK